MAATVDLADLTIDLDRARIPASFVTEMRSHPGFPEAMRKEFNNDDRFYPITYQKDWAVVRKIAEDSGTPYNKAAYDAEAKREADALARRQQQQQQAPKQ